MSVLLTAKSASSTKMPVSPPTPHILVLSSVACMVMDIKIPRSRRGFRHRAVGAGAAGSLWKCAGNGLSHRQALLELCP